MNGPLPFPYDLAFERNLGLVTGWEQLALRAKRVAIAGMGGVGGIHLLSLARLGIGGFTIADFDQFAFVNFNRQAGATMATVGRAKVAVMEEMALAINPELRIRRLDAGVTHETVDEFLKGADLFVDGLDFFATPIRRHVFARCAELRIPAVTAAPIGMGAAFLAFDPKGMTFEQYFRLEGRPAAEQHLRFLLGLTPNGFYRRYLVDPTRVDLAHHRGPSTVAACQLCAGVTAVAALKLLLGRGDVMPAPYNHQYDAYCGRHSVTRLAFGNAGPLQRLKIAVVRRLYSSLMSAPPVPDAALTSRSPIEEILNLARWAPSGDNAQPWTFRIVDGDTVRVQIRHEPANVYEYRNGEPTWLSAGMLLETMRIAATARRRGMVWKQEASDTPATITVHFPPIEGMEIDPLLSFVTLRSVDRRAYRWRSLSPQEKSALDACFAGNVTIDWHEKIRERWHVAGLSALATGIRLRCPEAFETHQRIIDWNHALSPSAIPARSVGLTRLTLPLMHWSMKQWERTKWLNRLGGARIAAAQMDPIPGLASGAYFVLRRGPALAAGLVAEQELIEIGRSIQRFWLTATRLGLAIQPVLATVAFANYGESRTRFTSQTGLLGQAEKLARSFYQTLGVTTQEVVFIGRIGEPHPRLPTHRSVRRPLAELMA